MSRPIDADALTDEIMERYCKGCDKRKGIKNGKYRIIYEIGDAPCRACLMDDMKDELENAPTIEPERKWIPTNVKPDPDLPEDDMSGYFLVTLHTYGNIGFDMDEYEVKKMRWDRVNGWVLPVHSPAWIEEALTQHILAWKPCPEPYREGDEV